MLDGLRKDGSGYVISGRPGTGKTAYIYLRLVESIIDGCPFSYQTVNGTVYYISESITNLKVNSWSEQEAVVAVVHDSYEPREFIRGNTHVYIIAASLPKGANPSGEELPNDLFVETFVTELWSFSEVFLTGSPCGPPPPTFE